MSKMNGKDNMLTGNGIILRPIAPEDTERVIKWRNSDLIQRYFLYRSEITRDDHENWLRNVVKAGKAVQWIIVESDSGNPIGSVYLRDIDRTNRKCEFGIFIGEPDKQGLGYGKEACLMAVQYAFTQLYLTKVYLKLLANNETALRMYKNVGFEIEGIFKMDRWINNTPIDVIYMARYKEIN